MVRLQICHVEHILPGHILISENEVVSVTEKAEKQEILCTKKWRVVHNLSPFWLSPSGAWCYKAVTSLFLRRLILFRLSLINTAT